SSKSDWLWRKDRTRAEWLRHGLISRALQMQTRKMQTRTFRSASSSLFRCFDTTRGRSARPARTGTRTATAAAGTTVGASTEHRLRLHRQQAFALQLLARQLARAADGFRLFSGFLLGGLLVMAAELHLAENPLALHLLLQRLEGLIDIVIANENLHAASSF